MIGIGKARFMATHHVKTVKKYWLGYGYRLLSSKCRLDIKEQGMRNKKWTTVKHAQGYDYTLSNAKRKDEAEESFWQRKEQ